LKRSREGLKAVPAIALNMGVSYWDFLIQNLKDFLTLELIDGSKKKNKKRKGC